MDWSYEEEVRVIYSTSKFTNVKFERSSIFEIIIGARCSKEDEQAIRDIVKRSELGIKIRKAVYSGYTFGVDIIDD
jgi:hypothetical protein